MAILQNGSMLILGVVCLFWFLGGWLIVIRCFDLPDIEQTLVGFALGLVAGNWLANLLARFISMPYVLWLSAFLIFVLGLIAAWPLNFRQMLKALWSSAGVWLIFFGITFIMWKIGRGLSIFDDYQNLPTVSTMATGDVPPHFSLDPSIRFGYHYFLLFLAAQFVRLGNMFIFNALDLVRAIVFALMAVLVGLWAYRATSSRLAGLLAGILMAFMGGMRWILLLLPASLLQKISAHTTLIGSGLESGPSLAENLLGPWVIDGNGPMQFPFAFVSGVHSSYFMYFGGFGVMHVLILLLLVMTCNRWKHWSAAIVTTILLASLALSNEITFGLLLIGLAVALIVYLIVKRTPRIPASLFPWISAAVVALVIASLQGGMLTETMRHIFHRGEPSYYDISFGLAWPPMIVSSHLGYLTFNNLWGLFLAFLEVGPVILVLPWVVWYGVRAVREERWMEAALVGAGVVSLFSIFFRYTGTGGVTGTTRLLEASLFACKLFAVPLLWMWVRGRSENWKFGLLVTVGAGILSGVMLFGISLIAAGKPVSTYFMNTIDVQMEQQYWNRLEPGALIFDPIPERAPTVFGRFTDAYKDWYDPKPEWEKFLTDPDPYTLHAAGFDYMYYGLSFWENLNPTRQALLQSPCATLVEQIDGVRSDNDLRSDYRRLVDIRNCK